MPRLFQIHGAGFDLPGEIVFDQILLFEIAIVQTDSRRAALRPDVVEGIGSAELEGNEMIEFAGLVIAGIVRRGGDAVPAISYLLLAVGGYAVADTAGTESRAAKDVESDGGIFGSGGAARIGQEESVGEAGFATIWLLAIGDAESGRGPITDRDGTVLTSCDCCGLRGGDARRRANRGPRGAGTGCEYQDWKNGQNDAHPVFLFCA